MKNSLMFYYLLNPNLLTRHIKFNYNIGKTRVSKIFHKTKYHPYKIELLEELGDRRIQFCEEIMVMCDYDPGSVNQQNLMMP